MPIYLFMIRLSIVLLPFSALPFRNPLLGEYSADLSIYPALLAILFFPWFSPNNKIKVNLVLISMLLFILTVVLSGMININEMLYLDFKSRSGIGRFIGQFVVLLFGFVYFLLMTIILKSRKNCILVYKAIKYAFYVNLFVSVIEAINNFILDGSMNFVFEFLEGILYPNIYEGGIRGLTFEASTNAMFMAFSLPYAVKNIFEENQSNKRIQYVILCISFLVIMLSHSRTGFMVIAQILIIIWLASKHVTIKNKLIILVSTFILTISMGIGINDLLNQADSVRGNLSDIMLSLFSVESDNFATNASNLSRFSLTLAAFGIGIDNPLWGVGLGQFGFYFTDYLPAFGWLSPEMSAWANNSVDSWPGAFNLYARLFAETGIFGCILFFSSFIFGGVRLYKNKLVNISDKYAILLSMFTVFLGSLNWESYRFLYFWVILAYLYVFSDYKVGNEQIKEKGVL